MQNYIKKVKDPLKGEVILSILLWFAFCGVVAYFANKRGRNPVAWGALAFLISPLLAGIILVLKKDLIVDDTIEEIKMDQAQLKDRVATNEKVMDIKFNNINDEMLNLAGNQANSNLQLDSQQPKQLLQASTKLCPFCNQEIKREAIKCKFCEQMVSEAKECPFCKEMIHKDAIKCKHCKSDIPLVQEESRPQVVEG